MFISSILSFFSVLEYLFPSEDALHVDIGHY